MQELIRECNKYFDKLFKDDESIDRYGIPFPTQNFKYFFDSGTGKVLQCSEAVYKLLVNLFENSGILNIQTLGLDKIELSSAMNDIKEAIRDENIFKARRLDYFNCAHVNNLEGMISQGCRQLILEVTEDCNLRCKYCIYGDTKQNFRGYSKKSMSFETAKKAIDYFISIADKKEDLILSFYGGEPLIKFDLIERTTKYFKEILNTRAKFNLTSNLTLLNERMAHFFADQEFLIICSLDGDEEIHNENRPFVSGKGSFEATLHGLEMLVQAYGEKAEKLIGINAVVDRPYSIEKFQRINDFFNGLFCISAKTNIRTSYVSRDVIADHIGIGTNIQLVMNKTNRMDAMGDWEYEKMKNKEDVRLKNQVLGSLLDIHKRRISDIPFKDSGLNACCVPGTRRLYVTTDGNFTVCEKIGKSPYIGDVENGLDTDQIRKYYVEDYTKKSKENCGNCWAFHLCSVCYANCYDENGLDMRRKKNLCAGSRFSMYHALIRYQTLQEEEPETLEMFNDEKYRFE